MKGKKITEFSKKELEIAREVLVNCLSVGPGSHGVIFDYCVNELKDVFPKDAQDVLNQYNNPKGYNTIKALSMTVYNQIEEKALTYVEMAINDPKGLDEVLEKGRKILEDGK